MVRHESGTCLLQLGKAEPERMAATIPGFLERMNAIFASERSNQFLLVGNIHDLVDARSLANGDAFQPLISFLLARLASRGHTPVRYDIG